MSSNDIIEAGAKAMFAYENCGKSDDVDDRWATCLGDSDYNEYEELARVALTAMLDPIKTALVEYVVTEPFTTHYLQQHERKAVALLIEGWTP